MGKSWFALQMSCAVASGKGLFGFESAKGKVLYLALEDSHQRLKARLQKQEAVSAEHIHFALRVPKMQDGLIEQTKEFLFDYPDTRLIIIDTLQHIRSTGNGRNIYMDDYANMGELRKIIEETNISLVLITHKRKMGDDDPMNRISGSSGLAGGSDGVLLLEKDARNGRTAELFVMNRDTDDFQFRLEFDPVLCEWRLLESGLETAYVNETGELIAGFMKDKPEWSGTATALLKAFAEAEMQTDFTPATLSKKLKKEQAVLLNKYKISVLFQTVDNQKIITMQKS